MIVFTGLGGPVNIRSPDFGDTEGLELTRISRVGRGNELAIFRDPLWPKTKTLRFTLSWLTESESHVFRRFVKSNLGRTCNYTDMNGVNYQGVFTGPISIVHAGVKNFTIEVEFQTT